MTHLHESSEAEVLLRDARAAEPAPMTNDRARELVRRAIDAAETRRRARRRRAAGAMMAVAAALIGVVATRTLSNDGGESVADFDLRTVAGDRIARTETTDFEVLVDQPERRRVALASGTVLCDVRPLGPGGSFEVDAGATHVLVRGTVFSVTRDDATVVRVYEGHVEVTHLGHVVELDAGERWSSADHAIRPIDHGPLADQGEAAAAARADVAVVAQSNTVADVPVADVIDVPEAVARAIVADRGAAPNSTTNERASLETEQVTANPGPSPNERTDLATERPAANPGPTSPRRASPSEAEGRIRDGDATAALDLASAAIARGEPGWRMVRADALRALGRHADAAEAYDETARAEPSRRAESAYAAAILRSRTLHDPAGALRSLDAGRTTDSALGERALVLRVRLLVTLGRQDEARTDARRYIERYGEGGSAGAMRELLGE